MNSSFFNDTTSRFDVSVKQNSSFSESVQPASSGGIKLTNRDEIRSPLDNMFDRKARHPRGKITPMFIQGTPGRNFANN